jgi:histidine kinase-like protein
MRRWLTVLLPESAARDDVLTVATELAANAELRHSASGQDGGYFAAEPTWYGPIVRVAVADGGAPTQPRVTEIPYCDKADSFDEHGRGLKMVQGAVNPHRHDR